MAQFVEKIPQWVEATPQWVEDVTDPQWVECGWAENGWISGDGVCPPIHVTTTQQGLGWQAHHQKVLKSNYLSLQAVLKCFTIIQGSVNTEGRPNVT